MKRKQTSIDLSLKLKIIEEVEKGVKSNTNIAKDFVIPKSTLSTILSNKEKLFQAIAAGSVTPTQKTKRIRLAKHENLESQLLTWLNSVRSANLPVSGPIIQEKGEKIAEDLDIEGIKGEKCHGGTRSKQRLTAVSICNSDGSEKLRLWIIGKWANPCCFKGIDRSKLPCEYSNQRNAWIDEAAFRQWLIKFDSRMRVQNRSVLLTLDNCSAHKISSL
ncbi:tigger transposable element-derived protein 6-like [Cotesia glomerata]|uniref:tigger transposable element-derived protein 6-like n=1 Tax=Cotesia glomerata TaxID=32391 RepID=UPI001D028CA4|nr:tigger transposable element-derived protein 6-like [Cotesia glomerata]